MMHIKEPLLLIKKSSPCGDSGYHLLLSEWSFTIICLTPYNRKIKTCLSVSLNKTFPSFLFFQINSKISLHIPDSTYHCLCGARLALVHFISLILKTCHSLAFKIKFRRLMMMMMMIIMIITTNNNNNNNNNNDNNNNNHNNNNNNNKHLL